MKTASRQVVGITVHGSVAWRAVRAMLLIGALLAPSLVAGVDGSAGAAELEPDFVRHAGENRFGTAVAVSEATFEPGVATAYVATGEVFADALAGGALAGRDGAPILLVERDVLPAVTAEELDRLDAEGIVVLGGPSAVSDAVVAALGDHTDGAVTRLAGGTRYETAAAISAAGFDAGVETVYVATGEDFPDGLAGSAAAAALDAPLLLTAHMELPQATVDELIRLGPEVIVLLGGTSAVSDAVAARLADFASEGVRRDFGASRYGTAAAASAAVFPDTADTVFLATGGAFPDALSGAPAAAAAGAPLLLTETDCVPQEVRDELFRIRPEEVVILGGTAAISTPTLRGCGEIPPPTFAVDEGLIPAIETIESFDDGAPRPVARVSDGRDGDAMFVEDEVLFRTDEQEALDDFLADWGGMVVNEMTPPGGGMTTYVVRIDPMLADPAGLVDDVRAIDPLSRGDHMVSSEAGMGLLAAVASEVAEGTMAGINWVGEAHSHFIYVDGVVTENPTGPPGWSSNPLDWDYMQLHEVDEAWAMLEYTGKLDNRVLIGMIDGGFAPNPDFPANTTGADSQMNVVPCTGGNPCPWHGTNTSQVAAAVADNGTGIIGTAGGVADLVMFRWTGSLDSAINGVFGAVAAGARIINMSFGIAEPASLDMDNADFQDATVWARSQGAIVVASAGNRGIDVDAEDCAVVECWEEVWHAPCENDGVVCVGGLAAGTADKHPNSNYGFESCGNARCEVDIFAPYTTFVGSTPPTNAGVRSGNGTSFSSPFVAGVAALMWAANPSLTDDEIEANLIGSAFKSVGPFVGRYVDASGAVARSDVVQGFYPPLVEIDAPADGATFSYGLLNEVTFEATAWDRAQHRCCIFQWTSSSATDGTQGFMGSGDTLQFGFGTPGQRVITVEAGRTDSVDTRATDSITVTAVNDPPAAAIDSPADGAELVRGLTYTFQGGIGDVNEFAPSCDQLSWESSNGADGFVAGTNPGCTPQIKFTTNGVRTITATATDDYGATDSAAVDVQVVDPPAAPTVSITNPTDGQLLQPDQPLNVTADVVEPDGDPITYEWTVDPAAGDPVVLSTAEDFTWDTPGDDVGFRCGGHNATLTITAEDPDGVGTETINIRVDYPLC